MSDDIRRASGERREPALPVLAVRSVVGGVLMGLANLVPGISGGTMLLAAGIYPRFVEGIAEVTTFRFRVRSLAVLGCVASSALVGIVLLAGTVKGLVVDHRWIMYSLFIGLTLGGVPIVWRLIGRHSRAVWVGAASGFAGMVALAYVQQSELGAAGGDGAGTVMLFLAGLAGASAMILPGVSGGYLLLVLGQYVPILRAIDELKSAVGAGAMDRAAEIGLAFGVPVALGVVVGIVGVSNVLRALLKRYRAATLGVLLGLLLGAVVGLWPFQQGVRPEVGDVVRGRTITAELLADPDPEDYPTRHFTPTPGQVAGAFGLILAGFGVTYAISRLGDEDERPNTVPAA